MKLSWFLRFFVFSVIFNSYMAFAKDAVQSMELSNEEIIEYYEESEEILENAEPINDGSGRYRFSIEELFFLSDIPFVYDNRYGWVDSFLNDRNQGSILDENLQRLQEAEQEKAETEIEEVRGSIEQERMQLEQVQSSPWQHGFQHQEFVHIEYEGLLESLEIMSDEVEELRENLNRIAESHNLHFITDVAFKHDEGNLLLLRRSSISLDMANSHIYLSDRSSSSYISSPERLPRGEFTQGISFDDIMTGSTIALDEEVQGELRWVFQDFQDKMKKKTNSIQSNYKDMRKEMKREVRWQRISRTEWGLGTIGAALFASYFLLPEVGRDIAAQFFVTFSAPIVQGIRDSIEWYMGYLKQINMGNVGCIRSLI